jgi:hypothetical protein
LLLRIEGAGKANPGNFDDQVKGLKPASTSLFRGVEGSSVKDANRRDGEPK